jgi:hypothetical protein
MQMRLNKARGVVAWAVDDFGRVCMTALVILHVGIDLE